MLAMVMSGKVCRKSRRRGNRDWEQWSSVILTLYGFFKIKWFKIKYFLQIKTRENLAFLFYWLCKKKGCKHMLEAIVFKSYNKAGTWAAQSVKHLTFDFSWGHDLRVMGRSPTLGSSLSRSLLLSFSGSICSSPCSCSLSLS